MDEIIYLEHDEEITSVIDKLKALEPDLKVVSLVIPKGATILQSVVNLKLLKKEGKLLDKDLSIVTQDRIGRNLASQAGFTVYDSVNSNKPITEPVRQQPGTDEVIELDLTEEKKKIDRNPNGISVHHYSENSTSEPSNTTEDLEPRTIPEFKSVPIKEEKIEDRVGKQFDEKYETEKTDDMVKPENNEIPHQSFKQLDSNHAKAKKMLKIVFAVITVLIVAFGILFYVYYPKATIAITVKTEAFEGPVEILIDNNIEKADNSKGAIPGDLIESEKESTKKFPATGKKDIGQKAKGNVTISNDSGDVQKISVGAELKSDSGLLFKSTSDATIPGATAAVDSHGNVIKTAGKVDVNVEANEAGDNYNIGATNFTVTGKSVLSGKSTSSMTGGLSKTITVVSQNDLNNAKNDLSKEIITSLHDDLKNKTNGKKVFDEGFKDETESSNSDKNVGDEATEFEMKVKAKSSTIDFVEDDYRKMVVEMLNKTIPSEKTLILSSGDEISITGADMNVVEGILKVNGNVKTKVGAKLDVDKIKTSIKGKNKSEIENILKENNNIDSVTVEFNPSWLIKKVPNRDNRIKIEVRS